VRASEKTMMGNVLMARGETQRRGKHSVRGKKKRKKKGRRSMEYQQFAYEGEGPVGGDHPHAGKGTNCDEKGGALRAKLHKG